MAGSLLRLLGGMLGALWLAACSHIPTAGTEPVRITFLQVNDLYRLESVDGGKRGGLVRVASLVRRIREENPNTLFVLAGDTLSPSVLSGIFQGEQMVAGFNAAGLDLATLGNHEFDFGPRVLRQRMKASRFRWVTSNVLERGTGQPFGGAVPYVLRTFQGIRVGILGLTLPETQQVSRTGAQVVVEPPLLAARKAVRRLRAQGAHLLVALTHQPMARDRALARALPLTLILGGHEHDPLEAEVEGTLITKAGSDGRYLVRVDLWVDRQGRLIRREHRFIPVTETVPRDPAVDRVIRRYKARMASALGQVVGQSRVALEARTRAVRTRESNLGNFIADAMREALQADVALVNGGAIRSNRVLPAGPLTREDLLALLPFPDTVVKVEVDGATLHRVLEHAVRKAPDPSGGFLQVSGLRFFYDVTRPPGQRVVRIRVGGRPLDPRARYTVALTSFLFQGGDGYVHWSKARVLVDAFSGPPLNRLVLEAVQRQGIIAPRTEGRIGTRGTGNGTRAPESRSGALRGSLELRQGVPDHPGVLAVRGKEVQERRPGPAGSGRIALGSQDGTRVKKRHLGMGIFLQGSAESLQSPGRTLHGPVGQAQAGKGLHVSGVLPEDSLVHPERIGCPL